MKLSKFWVFKLGFQVVIVTFLIYVMMFMLPMMFGVPELVGILAVLYLMCLIGTCGLVFFLCDIYKNEGKYYKKEICPITDFQVAVYSNLYIFVYKNKAWVIDSRFNGVLNLKEIEVEFIYNRKKELINFSPKLPYRIGV